MAMLKLGEKIVSARVVILILSLVLLIPAAYGYIKTRVNYDILSYLPKDIETMEGQDILVDQFGTGAFSLYVVEGMEDKDVSALKSKIEKVDHVSKVIWYDSFADLSVPKDMLPESLYDAFNNDEKNATMMAIIFDDTTSADGTMDAIEEIRSISNVSQRIAEAQRLGFEKCIIPKMSLRQIDPRRYKIGIIAVSNIRQAFDYLKKERGIS